MTNAPMTDEGVPAALHPAMGRAAVEGVPVGAIARIFQQDLGDTYDVLRYLHSIGSIAEIPKPDWPPTARDADRLPQFKGKTEAIDLQFVAQRVLKLTKLEGAFVAAMLRCDHADKSMLHGIIEQQRMQRPQRPDSMEQTDPKMVDVIICKVRKKLRDFDARLHSAIGTIWGSGYFIDAANKAIILQALTGNGVLNAQGATTN